MELKQILTELVAIDSTSSLSNEPLVSYIESYAAGSDVQIHRISTHDNEKINVLLVKGEPSENGLTLCGHMDTVPANPELWRSDPWTLTERDDNWYARGSCDMKGFVAIALQAIEHATVDDGCLAVLLLCDEEVGSFGAKHVLEHGLPVSIPKQVIIGEPTSLQAVRLHKGHLSLQIEIKGLSAHSGAPHLGKNAAVDGSKVISALSTLGTTFSDIRTDASKHFTEEAAFPVLTVATVQSGTAINVVPDRCTIGVGLRLLPDQDQEEVIEVIRQTIDNACSLSWKLTELGDNPTMLTAENSPVNTWLCEHLGQERSVGVSFGTDGGYLSRANYECVLYGPGDIGVAHKPDEFVPIEEMESCVETIDIAIRHYCGDQP